MEDAMEFKATKNTYKQTNDTLSAFLSFCLFVSFV